MQTDPTPPTHTPTAQGTCWLTLNQWAKRLRVSRRTIDRILPLVGAAILRVGRVVRVDVVAAERLLRGQS